MTDLHANCVDAESYRQEIDRLTAERDELREELRAHVGVKSSTESLTYKDRMLLANDREKQARAELATANARCAELENLLAACPQGEEGHACCDCPTPSEARLLSDYEQAHEDRMKEHAVVEELRTRCAELEDALDIVKRLNDEVGAERDELSREVVMRSDTVRDRLRKAEATLDRATAALRDFRDFGIRADLNPTINAANPPDYGWWSAYLRRADERVRDRARAALTPEGSEDGDGDAPHVHQWRTFRPYNQPAYQSCAGCGNVIPAPKDDR